MQDTETFTNLLSKAVFDRLSGSCMESFSDAIRTDHQLMEVDFNVDVRITSWLRDEELSIHCKDVSFCLSSLHMAVN